MRSLSRTLAVALAVCLIEQGSRAPAVAQQTPEAELPAAPDADAEDLGRLEALLDESVVITASRSAERTSTAPSTVYTITAHELRTFGIRTIDEALGYLGLGVYSAEPRDLMADIDVGAQGVLLRDRGRHILALLDGHVMNSQVHGGVSMNAAFGVPLETIDHLEVMLGAGSVMYGSNAMLLVVNVVTRRARDMQGVHAIGEFGIAAPHEGTSLVGGDQIGIRYRTGASGAMTFGEHGELMIAAEWLDDHSNSYKVDTDPLGGLRPGETVWGGQAQHRMVAPSGVLNARYRNYRLLMQANHYQRQMPLVGFFNDPRAREKQDALRFDLRHSTDLGTRVTLGSRLYADYHRFAESSGWAGLICLPEEPNGCWYQASANARWLGLEEQLSIDWLLDGSVSTLVGFDLRGRRTESDPADYRDILTNALPIEVQLPHFERWGFLGAIFAQQVWRPSSWLTLNAGARVDADTDFRAHVSPRAAITVEPVDGSSVRASYSEAFRGPTRYELDETDLVVRVAPTSLRPEIVRSVELEWQHRLSFATFALRGFGSYYYDLIDTRFATLAEYEAVRSKLASTADPNFLIINDNFGSIRSFGGSPSVVLRPARGLQLGGTFNYSHTRRDGKPLAVMPSMFGNARVSWQPVPDGVTLAAAAIIAGERRVIIGPLVTDSVIGRQFDLRTTLSGPTGISGLRFRASLTYIFNPYLPYNVTSGTAQSLVLTPVVSRLYGFVGLYYDFDPKERK